MADETADPTDPMRRDAIVECVALASAIRGPVMVWGNEVLVAVGAAADAIDAYRARGIVILGFEGFDTDGRHLLPRLDCISDFSSIDPTAVDAVHRSADSAIAALSALSPEPQFVSLVVHGAEAAEPPTWEPITGLLAPEEADAALTAWRRGREARGAMVRDEHIRREIARGADGRTRFRYSHLRRPAPSGRGD